MAIISVRNISKQYQLGSTINHDTLRDKIAQGLAFLGKKKPALSEAPKETSFWALKDISFDVEQGDVFGIVGRNGAGKSTMLKILSRITEPTEGEIRFRGRVGSLLEVGTGFHPELTGRENVYLNGSILGMRREEIKKNFDEIVAFAEVERFLDTPVKRYSSGMYVRLAFSVAAHFEPEILIIDEVLSVGDVGFQKKCLGKMQNVAGHGRTVLFVSHNMGAVRSLCNKCILLENGQIKMKGQTGPVLDSYMTQDGISVAKQLGKRITCDVDRGKDYFLTRHNDDGGINFLCGDKLKVEFDIETPKDISNLSCGLTLLTMLGDPVVSMSSKVQNVPSRPGPSKKWRVQCDLGKFPINAGTYAVYVYLGDGDKDVARFSDAFTLNVIPNDVFGWGNELPTVKQWGPVYWAPDWDIHPE